MDQSRPTLAMVMSALRTCYDPEIPLNIVDLGLIYDVSIDGGNVHVKYTLTARGCPAHELLSRQMHDAVERVPGVSKAEVEVVWDPPWTPERMSDEAKRQLQTIQEENSRVQHDFDPSIFKPKKRGHLVRNPDGTLILINTVNERYRVNEDIAALWERAEGTRTIDEITSLVGMELQLSPLELRPQIIELFRSLVTSGLVEPAETNEHQLPLQP